MAASALENITAELAELKCREARLEAELSQLQGPAATEEKGSIRRRLELLGQERVVLREQQVLWLKCQMQEQQQQQPALSGGQGGGGAVYHTVP
jgi:hypothetical protein